MSLTNLRIANYLELETTCNMERVREFQYVYLIVFTKELKRRPIFVSKKAIAPVREKPILRAKPITPITVSAAAIKTESTYLVLKTWDNNSSYLGDRVISILVIERGTRRPPFWQSVFEKQNIKKGDILREGNNGRLVNVKQGVEVEHSVFLGVAR